MIIANGYVSMYMYIVFILYDLNRYVYFGISICSTTHKYLNNLLLIACNVYTRTCVLNTYFINN